MIRRMYLFLAILLCMHGVCFAALRSEEFVRIQGQRLKLNQVIADTNALSAIDCSGRCLIENTNCVAVNYNPSTGECQLCNETPLKHGVEVETDASWNLYHATATCDTSWIYFDTSCYFFNMSRANWEDSVAFCNALGARLVEINDLQENTFVSTVGAGDVWLGLNDIDDEGIFVWPSGAITNFTKFGTGEGTSANEDCNVIKTGYGTWHDVACYRLERILCEKSIV